MKQKCPTCNAGPDKDIFGMCSECRAINRPYEDLPAPAPAQTKREGFVTVAIVV